MPAPERSARIQRVSDATVRALAPRGQPAFFDWLGTDGSDEADSPAQSLIAGLLAAQAAISPAYFYDALGSTLFAAICELPEYYPTRTERALFAQHRDAIARANGEGGTLIDLGAGDCRKAESLFDALRPAQYVAVDVSVDYLRDTLAALARRHPDIDVIGVGMDFSAGVRLPQAVSTRARTFFYPGSSIGNFDPAQAVAFLRSLHAQAGDDGALLIGVDLVKPAEVLVPAYDDALGVTAAFNRNALAHVNRVLGADFEVRGWRHVALWNAPASRIEMHLQATRDAVVRWPGGERRFLAGERIHTEHSYKYSTDGFEALLREAGWHAAHCWTDPCGWFSVFHARAADRPRHDEPVGVIGATVPTDPPGSIR